MIVRHGSGSYAVEFTTMADAMEAQSSLVITDRNVDHAWSSVIRAPKIVVPPGEETKSLEHYSRLVRDLAARGLKRSGSLVALGGGVVGDLVGFVASTYMRGIPFVQIPTTLLAMVDSSVGGKVGIDLPEGKNLVGAFWPPKVVKIPLDALTTLPARQFRNGMAEVWKYGFILEPGLCDRLARKPLTNESSELEVVISRCVQLKAEIVQEDEHDRTGRRAILNFGHTVGHAIETVTGYSGVLHGEAVAIGMVVESRIGERLGLTKAGTADRIEAFLRADGLPTTFPNLGADNLMAAMRGDKKAETDGLAFSLVTELGRCKLVTGIAEADVSAILRSL